MATSDEQPTVAQRDEETLQENAVPATASPPTEDKATSLPRTGDAPVNAKYIKRPEDVIQRPADLDNSKGGTFKKRPISDVKSDPSENLCRSVASGEGCPYGEECRFSHDIDTFLRQKRKDLGDTCPVFEAVGYCRFGASCRFAGHHFHKNGDEYKNDNVENANNVVEHETNNLNDTVRQHLRKNTYPFWTKAQRKSKATAQVDADESPLLPERKPVDFKDKIYVAPLTTVGNLPFRRLLKQQGADITCGEMALAPNLLKAQQSEWALLRRHESEDVFGVQIAGAHGDQMARVCELLARETDVDFVDINMGCPIDVVCKTGAGSALMNRPPRLTEVVSGSLTGLELGSAASGKPAPGLTVKMRTGWSEKSPVAHKLVPKIQATKAANAFMNTEVVKNYKLRAEQYVDAMAIHGRSRLQRYTKTANWDYIYQCDQAQSSDLPHVPFIGGGDVLSYEEFDQHLKDGKLSTAMIARGALIKPWLPTEIKERRHMDISASERLDMLKDFVKFGLEHWGSDDKGVERTRRYLLEWQSFLCRYIPVGLLDRLPPHINDRPPPYYGRNDLETLMASDQAVDWIKISEMLLGPVPDNFRFVPKHKANAYATTTTN